MLGFWILLSVYSVLSVVQKFQSKGNAFDSEFGVLEVEKQSGFQAGYVEVSEHLCDVAFIEGGDDFGVHDDRVGDDQIGNEGADVLAVVVDFEILLAFA